MESDGEIIFSASKNIDRLFGILSNLFRRVRSSGLSGTKLNFLGLSWSVHSAHAPIAS